MSGFLVAFVLFFTAFLVVSLGVAAAYGAVTGILYALAPQSERRIQPAVLVPSETHVSGD